MLRLELPWLWLLPLFGFALECLEQPWRLEFVTCCSLSRKIRKRLSERGWKACEDGKEMLQGVQLAE